MCFAAGCTWQVPEPGSNVSCSCGHGSVGAAPKGSQKFESSCWCLSRPLSDLVRSLMGDRHACGHKSCPCSLASALLMAADCHVLATQGRQTLRVTLLHAGPRPDEARQHGDTLPSVPLTPRPQAQGPMQQRLRADICRPLCCQAGPMLPCSADS